jgi:hypothetical protein
MFNLYSQFKAFNITVELGYNVINAAKYFVSL